MRLLAELRQRPRARGTMLERWTGVLTGFRAASASCLDAHDMGPGGPASRAAAAMLRGAVRCAAGLAGLAGVRVAYAPAACDVMLRIARDAATAGDT